MSSPLWSGAIAATATMFHKRRWGSEEACAHQSILEGCTDGMTSADVVAWLLACRAWRLSCSWPCPPPSACWCCAAWRPVAPPQVRWAGWGAFQQPAVCGLGRQALESMHPGQHAPTASCKPHPASAECMWTQCSALRMPCFPACCIRLPAASKRQMVSFAVDQQTTLVESNDKPTVTPAMLAVSQQPQALLWQTRWCWQWGMHCLGSWEGGPRLAGGGGSVRETSWPGSGLPAGPQPAEPEQLPTPSLPCG